MGGNVLPGAMGNMYARHGAPSEGKYAKKTMPSAEEGYELLPTPEDPHRKYKLSAVVQSAKEILNPILRSKNPEVYDKWEADRIAALRKNAVKEYDASNPLSIYLSPEEVKAELNKQRKGYYEDYIGALKGISEYDLGKESYVGQKESNQPIEGLNYGSRFATAPVNLGRDQKGAESFRYSYIPKTEEYKKENFQNGGEMSFYQNGLDWTPRNISKNGGWLDKYNDDVSQAQVGTMVTPLDFSKPLGTLQGASDVMSAPARTATYLLTGKYQDPSQALGINNPWGAFAADMLLDPMNLVGAGVATKAVKAAKAATKTSKVVKPAISSSVDNVSRGLKSVGKNLTKNSNEALLSDLKIIASNINPKNLKTQSGLDWMKNWYSNPEFSRRYSASGLFNPEIMQSTALNKLEKYKPKNYLDLLKDKGLSKYLESSIDSGGISWGTPKSIYVNRTMYAPFNRKGLESVRVHELSHLVDTNGNLLGPADENALLKPFGISNSSKIPKNPGFFRREILGDRPEYFLDPTEIHARMNQSRFDLGLSPNDVFTEEMFNNISKNKNWYGMGKYIKDKKSFIDLMNNFWSVPPAVIGASSLQEKKQGGIVKDDNGYWNPENWGKPVEIGSNEITMQGVYEPLLGVSDTGDTQMMYPGEDYTFNGESVTEYPVKKNGGWLDKYQEGGKLSNKQSSITQNPITSLFPALEITKPDVTVAPKELIDPIKPDGGYVINKGDTLSKIAKETGVPVKKIAQANNIKNINKINIGQKLIIPSSTVKQLPEKYQNWEVIKNKTNDLNKLNDLEKIVKYHKNTPDEIYSIVDKKSAKLNIYKGDSLIKSFEIGVGETFGDAQTVTKNVNGKTDWDSGNKSTGAGVYTVSNINPSNDAYYGLPSFNLKNEQGIEVATSIHGTPKSRRKYFNNNTVIDNRMSNGCINGKCQDLPEMYKYLEENSKIYILPEDKGNRFEIVDGKPVFRVDPKNAKKYETYIDKKGNVQKGQGVNRSINTLVYKPIKSVFNEDKFKDDTFTTFDFNDEKEYNQTTKPFIKSLTDNKKKVMEAAQIPSDIYNELAKMSFGILGTESNYGDTHSAVGNFARAINKSIDKKSSSSPDYKSKATTYSADEENRSVGLTQMRWNYLNDKEKAVLKKLGINSNKDFLDPKKAAIGTTAILGVRYNEQLDSDQKKDIWKHLPNKWNKRSNYGNRVKANSSYLNFEQLSPTIK
jgi:LysM repeat protein